MAGIKHHTQAYVDLNSEGVDVGRIPKLSYNEEHDIDNASIAVAKLSDHTKAVHDALLIVPGDHASAHQNGGDDEIDVTGLSGELVDAQPPKSHGNEAHSSTFITSAALSGYEQQTNKGANSGYCGLDSTGLVAASDLGTGTDVTTKFLRGDQTYVAAAPAPSYGDTKLWNTALNDVPAGWHVCDGTNGTEDLSASNPSVNTVYIMYIGGEYQSMTARTINITNNASSVTSYALLDSAYIATITEIEDGAPFWLTITNTDESYVHLKLSCIRNSDSCTIFQVGAYVNMGEIFIATGAPADFLLTQYLDCTWIIDIAPTP